VVEIAILVIALRVGVAAGIFKVGPSRLLKKSFCEEVGV
jgi:hypothetical protein